MRVGVIEILGMHSPNIARSAYSLAMTKQYASIMPQAISVWSRRQGHRVFYGTYYGVGDPSRTIPADLDVVFVSCYTQASPLAYALARLYARRGARTIIGGPHAKAFPVDCLRFFDLVVKECDESTVVDILRNVYRPGSIITSRGSLANVPSVQERMREIAGATFYRGKVRAMLSTIPLLASTGCPYRCDFCVDWNNAYTSFGADALLNDLTFVSTHYPGLPVAFHDPNFGVRFDDVVSTMETIPRHRRPPYLIESSLTVLRPDRMDRLKESNCVYVAPGIESWSDYSNKAGVGRRIGMDKVDLLVARFAELHESVPYIQGNLMFGVDTDSGSEPVELTKEFTVRAPYVWPAVNIPVPFGGTPLQERLVREDRVLRSMPFAFYYAPYVVMRPKNYNIVEYYEFLVQLLEHVSSSSMLRRRLVTAQSRRVAMVHTLRTAAVRGSLGQYRRILARLQSDNQLRRFHNGDSSLLPDFYRSAFDRLIGRYGELLSPSDRFPDLAFA